MSLHIPKKLIIEHEIIQSNSQSVSGKYIISMCTYFHNTNKFFISHLIYCDTRIIPAAVTSYYEQFSHAGNYYKHYNLFPVRSFFFIAHATASI